MSKTIIITGAGSGIGAATALELSSSPETRLVLLGRTAHTLTRTLSKLANRDQHLIHECDVSSADEIRNAYQHINLQNHNVVGIFANAGIGGENHYGENDRWKEILSVNLDGTYNSIMETLPHLEKSSNKYTHVVITSSCLARFGVPNYTAYCTSKAGLLGLTKSLAIEWASKGILVNAICPGWVDTEMARNGIQQLAESNNLSYEESYSEQVDMVPTKKMSEPMEIAKLVSFLMSNLQFSITGQGIDINNGAFMI